MKARAAALTVAVLATAMAFIDATALNVALPAIQDGLEASGPQLLWILNAYAVPLAALLLPAGAMGDRCGRRRVFAAGVAVFALASLACGLAPGALPLIAARAVQGAGAAIMLPGSLAIIAAAYPGERRGRAIGVWSATTVVATALGPVLGGVLASAGWWRAVFFVNLPLAAAALAMLPRVAESRDPSAPPLHATGAVLGAIALAALSYGGIEAPVRGHDDPGVIGVLAIGFVGLALFVLVESRAAHPLLPLGVFRDRVFAVACVVTLLVYTAFNAIMLFLPLNLIEIQGYGADQAGLAQLPVIVMVVALSPVAGRMVDRRGPRLPLVLGTLLAGAGFALLATAGATAGPSQYWWRFLPALAALGAGLGLTIAPLSAAIMASIGPRRFGLGSGINSTLSRLAGVLGVALLGGAALVVFARSIDQGSRTMPPDLRESLLARTSNLAGAQVPASLPPEQRDAGRALVERSFLEAFGVVAWSACGLSWAAAAACAAMPRGRTMGACRAISPDRSS